MRLETRLEQRLVLTPQLQLNLALLQMPTLDLVQRIEQELMTNPALEEVEEYDGEEATAETELPGSDEDSESEIPSYSPNDLPDMTDRTPLEREPIDSVLTTGDVELDAIGELLEDEDYYEPAWRMVDHSEREDSQQFETVADENIRLSDCLLPQVRSRITPAEFPLAETILESIDDDGYLLCSLPELCARAGADPAAVTRILKIIQHLEGGGIGAQDLCEALLLQLETMGYAADSIECRMLTECAESVWKRQYESLARYFGVTVERIKEAIAVISRLETRPGRRFSALQTDIVRPDFCVEWQDGKLVFYPQDFSLPRLRLSRRYREILRNRKAFSPEEIEIARKKYELAQMFLRGIESRRRTLGKIMKFILEKQYDFFCYGREYLKPVSIKDAGAVLGIHPSTISRAVQGKWVATPYGHFRLRHFFTSGTDGCARHSVKDKLKRLIELEDKRAPLSDEELAERLSQQGIRVKRRTIAKYRAELKIPGCRERREPCTS